MLASNTAMYIKSTLPSNKLFDSNLGYKTKEIFKPLKVPVLVHLAAETVYRLQWLKIKLCLSFREIIN